MRGTCMCLGCIRADAHVFVLLLTSSSDRALEKVRASANVRARAPVRAHACVRCVRAGDVCVLDVCVLETGSLVPVPLSSDSHPTHHATGIWY